MANQNQYLPTNKSFNLLYPEERVGWKYQQKTKSPLFYNGEVSDEIIIHRLNDLIETLNGLPKLTHIDRKLSKIKQDLDTCSPVGTMVKLLMKGRVDPASKIWNSLKDYFVRDIDILARLAWCYQSILFHVQNSEACVEEMEGESDSEIRESKKEYEQQIEDLNCGLHFLISQVFKYCNSEKFCFTPDGRSSDTEGVFTLNHSLNDSNPKIWFMYDEDTNQIWHYEML